MSAGEVISAHAVVGFGVANDRFDGRAATQLAFDGVGDAALLAGDIDFHLVVERGVVAAVAAVGDDASKARADLRLDLRNDGFERVAVPRVKPEGRLPDCRAAPSHGR